MSSPTKSRGWLKAMPSTPTVCPRTEENVMTLGQLRLGGLGFGHEIAGPGGLMLLPDPVHERSLGHPSPRPEQRTEGAADHHRLEDAFRAGHRDGSVHAAGQEGWRTLDDPPYHLQGVVHPHQRARPLSDRLGLLATTFRVRVEAGVLQGQRRLISESLEEPSLPVAELDGMAVRHDEGPQRALGGTEGHREERALP